MTGGAAPVRRSQAERRAETRDKVLRATADCLAELGFAATTVAAVAERAGVTWGAIQHQFPDKDAILDAVLEASLHDFETLLSGASEAPARVEARAAAFVQRCGWLLREGSYRAFIEIQHQRRHDPRGADRAAERSVDRIWSVVFGDLGLPAEALAEARRFSFASLYGISGEATLYPQVDRAGDQLETLERVLRALLRGVL